MLFSANHIRLIIYNGCIVTKLVYFDEDHKFIVHASFIINLHVLICTFTHADHVNIVQNKSGYDVLNNSIVNAFNNSERSVVLDCVTVRGHENATWEFQNSPEISNYIKTTITNVSLSTIMIVEPDMNITVSLKCISVTSKEYRIVTVTTGTYVCMYVGTES